MVKPPMSMGWSKKDAKEKPSGHKAITTKDTDAARRMMGEDGDSKSARLAGHLERLPEKMRKAVVSGEDDTQELPESPPMLRKVQTMPLDGTRPTHGKGQAHNILEDQLYLNIGPGPEVGDGTQDGGQPVCESPPNADFNVYEKAYEREVEEIHRSRGRRATVYLTRRVEEKWERFAATANNPGPAPSLRDTAKSGLASIVGKAADGRRESQQVDRHET